MPAKKKFLLRLDPAIYGALEKWAADEFRSVNGQMEFLLQDAVRRAGRLAASGASPAGGKEAGHGDAGEKPSPAKRPDKLP